MTIRGVLDAGQANQDWAAAKTTKPPIELFAPRRRASFKDRRKLHHKLMVIAELEPCGWLRTRPASSRSCRSRTLQLVHLSAERGSPKFEPAARHGLVRHLSEGTPSLQDVAKATASLAKREQCDEVGRRREG